ncbi:MAG TPA: DUF459 domain-containing protein [Acidothermaceae bacterium]|nr:DUF459 domain-containing protein [Acidothermaceae bacterium]
MRSARCVAASLFVAALAVGGCTNSTAVSATGTASAPASASAPESDVASAGAPPAAAAAPPVVVASPGDVSSPTLPTPMTVVEIGDSLGEDLGFGLHDVLRSFEGVELVQAAKGNSGLVQPQYYDWPTHLSTLLAAHRPDVVVVFIGANDVQDFYAGGVLQQFGTVGWKQAYAQRVATLMAEATAAGAKMLWVGMPVMKSATFSSSMAKLNDIFQAQAAVHPGVTYFPSWDLFTDATGRYVKTAQIDGKSVTLRTPDGVHITFGNGGGGADMLARAVVGALPGLLAG